MKTRENSEADMGIYCKCHDNVLLNLHSLHDHYMKYKTVEIRQSDRSLISERFHPTRLPILGVSPLEAKQTSHALAKRQHVSRGPGPH